MTLERNYVCVYEIRNVDSMRTFPGSEIRVLEEKLNIVDYRRATNQLEDHFDGCVFKVFFSYRDPPT